MPDDAVKKALSSAAVTPVALAQAFLKDYYGKEDVTFPIDPFRMLLDQGVSFVFRSFKSYEGIYIQAESEVDFALVGINSNRPITRQRFTAAHELCHHLKDAGQNITCGIGSQSQVERFAENFAAELLMPSVAFNEKIKEYEKSGYVDFDSVLQISYYFGVSFSACVNRLAYQFHKIEGDTSPTELKKRVVKYKPVEKCKSLGLTNLNLYRQLFDTGAISYFFEPNNYAKQLFQSEYVFNDSRLEGIDIENEAVAEIVADLRINKQDSEYCTSTNKNIIEVSGLTMVYDCIFDMVNEEISLFSSIKLHRLLYTCAPEPDYGGKFRNINTLVLGAKFETVDCNDIFKEFESLDLDVQQLLHDVQETSISDYIERALKIHHRFTVIHPFSDGNGRTSRAFLNLLLLKKNIPPIYFNYKEKDVYIGSLGKADITKDISDLYEICLKQIIKSSTILSQSPLNY